MTPKNAKRTWNKIATPVAGSDVVGLDLNALKHVEQVFALKNESKALAADGMKIMKDPKVVAWKQAVFTSRKLGPQFVKLGGGSSDFTQLKGIDPLLDKALAAYFKADKILKNPAMAAEAKAMIAKADQIFEQARTKLNDAASLAGTYGIKLEGGVA